MTANTLQCSPLDAASPTNRMPRFRFIVMLTGLGLLNMSGCVSPLYDQAEQTLRESVIDSVRREIAPAEAQPEPVTMKHTFQVDPLNLKPATIAELEEMAGLDSYQNDPLVISPDLQGMEQKVVGISLEHAIHAAIQQNLSVQFARLAPGIAESQVVAAQAAFDWILFSNSSFSSTDQPRTSPAIGGQAVGLGSDIRKVVDITSGIRRRFNSGGQLTIQNQYTYTNVLTPGLSTAPNPANLANLSFQIDQPLLRGFGSDVSLAQIRVSSNAQKDAIAQLKSDLLNNANQTEQAYWQLVQSHADLLILRRLLQRGIQVRDTVKARIQLDATQAQVADAVARVENRRADVLRAENTLRQASDQLKALINDPQLTVGSEILLVPVDRLIDEPVVFSLYDSIVTALSQRPEIQQAILAIDDASIRQQVANNARLPQLDLRMQLKLNALDTNMGDAYSNVGDGRFIDYLVGLVFEQPLGNRLAESGYRQRRLERMQAVVSYRNTVQQILLELKGALRDVRTNHELIAQTRQARIAGAENLRSLRVEMETIRSLDTNTLDLQLRRQESLAIAEQAEVAALVNYATALSRIYAAMGTSLKKSNVQFQIQDVNQGLDTQAGRWWIPESWANPDTADDAQQDAEVDADAENPADMETDEDMVDEADPALNLEAEPELSDDTQAPADLEADDLPDPEVQESLPEALDDSDAPVEPESDEPSAQ